MLKLRMSLDKVSLFAHRFRDKEPNSQPIAWDGEVLQIPDEFAVSAKALFDKGFAPTPDELKAYAVYQRAEKEVAGVKVGKALVSTDSESVTRIMLVAMLAASNSALKVEWKAKDGNFIGLDAVKVTEMAKAVAKRMVDCANTEASVVAAIFSGTMTSKEQIAAAFKAIG